MNTKGTHSLRQTFNREWKIGSEKLWEGGKWKESVLGHVHTEDEGADAEAQAGPVAHRGAEFTEETHDRGDDDEEITKGGEGVPRTG